MKAKKGDKVQIEYEGTLTDGTVFDSSAKHGQPLEFELGSGQVIPGFDKGVTGMEVGEEKEIDIPCAEAYGEKRAELVKAFPKDQFPAGEEPKEGMVIGLMSPDGRQIPAQIAEVTATEVKVDLNHPLAGKDLHFKIKLVKIN